MSNYKVTSSVSVQPTNPLAAGFNAGGERGGGREFTETFSFTVVAARVNSTRKHKLTLEGNRCLQYLCSLDGVLLERDRVAIFNTVQNIIRANNLQFTEKFEPTQVRIGFAQVSVDALVKFLTADRYSAEVHRNTSNFMGDEILTISTVSEGDGRVVLRSGYKDVDDPEGSGYDHLFLRVKDDGKCIEKEKIPVDGPAHPNSGFQWSFEVLQNDPVPDSVALFGDTTSRKTIKNFVRVECRCDGKEHYPTTIGEDNIVGVPEDKWEFPKTSPRQTQEMSGLWFFALIDS